MTRDMDSLGEQIAEDVAHIDAALHRVLAKLRVFDEAGGWFRQGFRSCAQWLAWRVGWGPGTAREHVRVANALAKLPAIDAALAAGALSYCKVRALTRVATPENEHVLLEQAQLLTGHQLEQVCRKYAAVARHDEGTRPNDDLDRRHVSRRDTEDGMVLIEASLHPEEAALVWTMLQRVAADRRRDATPDLGRAATGADLGRAATAADRGRDVSAGTPGAERGPSGVSAGTPARPRPAFDRADALVHVAACIVRGDRPERSPTELVVTLPVEALVEGHDHPRRANGADACAAGASDPTHAACCADGTAISTHAARRLACDAGLVALVEDEAGNVLAVGRKRRTISGSMKRALLRRDQTCRFPGCRARAFLEGHHIEHWANGGATELANILALCSHHHRFVHEYGFTIELDTTTNTVTAYDEHGRRIPEVAPSPAPHLADLGWANVARRNAGLAITADTLATWDGTPVDYPALVDWIIRTDDRTAARASTRA